MFVVVRLQTVYNLLTNIITHRRVVFLSTADTEVKLCNDWMVCLHAVRTKLSHTSNIHQLKLLSHGIFEGSKFFGKAQNSMVSQQDTST